MTDFTGDAGNNTITGTDGDDRIQGLEGNDILNGAGGNDILIGGPGADVLTGGTGADTFRGSAADMNGDRITDFLIGDRIQFLDLTLADAKSIFTVGNMLQYNGGSIQIDNLGPGRLVLRAITGGGIEVRLQAPSHNDFNGDGFSDLLWRDSNGLVYNFLGNDKGGFVNNGGNSAINVAAGNTIIGTGDFNGDGRVDVLFRTGTGSIFNLLATANGGYANNGDNSFVNGASTTSIVGTGDFNGDGRQDILWRNPNGTIFNFLGTANGGYTNNGDNSAVTLAATTQIIGVGDFNGDGRDDLLMRDSTGAVFDFLGSVNGGYTNNGDNSYVMIATGTNVAGIGDFNGDGLKDILWRDSSGTIFNFLGTANGGYVNNGSASAVHIDSSVQIASVGDFNGDAIDDILFRDSTGHIFDFLGTPSGGYINNGDNSFVALSTTTQIQDPFH
jgi:hypothetical protein